MFQALPLLLSQCYCSFQNCFRIRQKQNFDEQLKHWSGVGAVHTCILNVTVYFSDIYCYMPVSICNQTVSSSTWNEKACSSLDFMSIRITNELHDRLTSLVHWILFHWKAGFNQWLEKIVKPNTMDTIAGFHISRETATTETTKLYGV